MTVLNNTSRAGFVGGFLDREIETKGLDWFDRERAQRQGETHVLRLRVWNSWYF